MSAAGSEGSRPVCRVAVLTTGRQDWGILRSTCEALRDTPGIELRVLAGGMHLSNRHGRTVERVREAGFEPVELAWLSEAGDDAPDRQAAEALARIGEALRDDPPDALVLVGDRFETAAAALAATLARVPIVHLHGGEQSLGAFDDALRHAITKLAHLHLVSADEHAHRVVALGEDPGSVRVVGAPGLDNAFRADLPDRAALERELGIALVPPVVLVTVHPATLDPDPAAVADAVAAAMAAVPATYVVTLPNVDPGGERVRSTLVASVSAIRAAGTPAVAVEALGEVRYWGLLRLADALLGNSSSGLVEAPALRVPAVNVGDRQAGRLRWPSVVDAPADARAVTEALRTALDPAFRDGLDGASTPLADGRAGRRVADIIAAWRPTRPPRKPPVRIEG